MVLGGGASFSSKKKRIGEIRRAQLVTTFGSGSIADLRDYSVIIGATDLWKDIDIDNDNDKRDIIDEPNLRRLLNVKYFRQPPTSGNESKSNDDIPAFRFPEMHFCPQCGDLMPYWEFDTSDKPFCHRCNKSIIPSRFIAACINGHLEDFPYDWWVHGGHFTDCHKKDRHNLKIESQDTSGGLESIVITCKVCNARRSMAQCMGKMALIGYPCHGKRPWVGHGQKYNDQIKCHAQMRTLQRGASNVYFPITESALTIPPWSSKLQQIIKNCWLRIVKNLKDDPELSLKSACRYEYNGLSSKNLFTFEEFYEGVKKRIDNENGAGNSYYSHQGLVEEEYRTFCRGNRDDGQLKLESTNVPELLKGYIDDVVLARRLREVMVLRGFRRITPEKPADTDDFIGVANDMMPLSSTSEDWLPAIEMLGEGFFIKIQEASLQDWEISHKKYYDAMEARLANSTVKCDNFSPRYVLLHTLAHLLIRQLSIECGYSGAAIKEKIYSTYPNSAVRMAGILIYTSTSDSDGSLGGLVRNGLADKFEMIFRSMLQEASWCSSDPICIESKAQGYDALNYAACHACTLLPETSCRMRNCLLDRASIVGTLKNKEVGFFSQLLVK